MRRLWAVTWLCLLGACPESEAPTQVERDACNLTAGHELEHGQASHYDGQAISAGAREALAAWSVQAGTFTRLLGADGAPRAQATRVAQRCAGGLSLSSRKAGGYWLACLRPEAGAYVYELDAAGNTVRHEYLGQAGRDSQGIALATRGPHWITTWHDGTPGAYRVWLVREDGDGPSSAALLSDPSFAAAAPSLAMDGDEWVVAWAETRFDGGRSSSTRIALKREDGPTQTLGATMLDQPAPQLVLGAARRWLGFRSQQKGDRQPQLYVVELSPQLKPVDDPIRVGRANTRAAPVLLDCEGRRFASMSRMYGGERYLALHPLDEQLQSVGGGYQYYANSRDYVGVAASCQPQGMLVLAAERTAGLGDGARLMAATMRCR